MNAKEKDQLVAVAAAYVKNLEQYLAMLDQQVADKAKATADLAILRARLASAAPVVDSLIVERDAIIAASTIEEDGVFPGEKVSAVVVAPENVKKLETINRKLHHVEQESARIAELESKAAQWVGFGNLAFRDVPEIEARELIGALLTSRRAVLELLLKSE